MTAKRPMLQIDMSEEFKQQLWIIVKTEGKRSLKELVYELILERYPELEEVSHDATRVRTA